VFRGGVPAIYNRVVLRTRASEQRSKAEYGEHCRDIVKSWDGLMCKDEESILSERRLRTVWVLGALTTALELGVQRPEVGKEEEWLVEHQEDFRRLADAGDEDARTLLL
jgi:hypothetical protein